MSEKILVRLVAAMVAALILMALTSLSYAQALFLCLLAYVILSVVETLFSSRSRRRKPVNTYGFDGYVSPGTVVPNEPRTGNWPWKGRNLYTERRAGRESTWQD